MDSSLREQVSETERRTPKRIFGGLKILASLINWLAGLISLTEEEREDAGIIYRDHPGVNK